MLHLNTCSSPPQFNTRVSGGLDFIWNSIPLALEVFTISWFFFTPVQDSRVHQGHFAIKYRHDCCWVHLHIHYNLFNDLHQENVNILVCCYALYLKSSRCIWLALLHSIGLIREFPKFV